MSRFLIALEDFHETENGDAYSVVTPIVVEIETIELARELGKEIAEALGFDPGEFEVHVVELFAGNPKPEGRS